MRRFPVLLLLASLASAQGSEPCDNACRVAAAEAAVAARPKDSCARYALGVQRFNQSIGVLLVNNRTNYDLAIDELSESIALNPNFDALYLRGRAYSNRSGDGDAKKAVADFTMAMALKPGDIETIYFRGNAHYVDKNWKSAIVDYEHTLALDPKNSGANLQLGICRQHLKDYPGALKAFDRAIALAGDSETYLYSYRAKLHDLMGNPTAAEADRKQTAVLKPKE